MKTLIKLLPIITLTLLTSCLSSTVVEEIECTVKRTKSTPAGGYLALTIDNSAPNTLFEIDSIEICNIKEYSTNKIQFQNSIKLSYGADTTLKKINLPQQKLIPWNPDILPQLSKSSYIKINGKIYTYFADSTLFLLNDSPMYTTITGNIIVGETTHHTITLKNNCPIYIEHSGTMTNVLREIDFEVIINDWEE